MNRAALFVALVAIVPAAGAAAWVPCEQPGIEAPVPLDREAPGYPPAVREIGVEGVVEVALVVLRDGTVGWVRALEAEPRGYFEQAAIAGVRARILSATPPGLFNEAALVIARASRLTPAYRDGVPIESVALLTLFFDPARATCPGNRSPDRDRPPTYRPAPRVTRTMKGPAAATTG